MFETLITSPAALSRHRNGPLAAEVDLARKAKALETCADNVPDLSPPATPTWHSDSTLMAFLDSL